MGAWSSLSTISGSHVHEIFRPLFQASLPTWVGDLPTLITVNVVVLAGSVAADPVIRRMPSGDEVAHIADRWDP